MKYIGQYSSPEDIATLDKVRSVEVLATDANDLAENAKNALAEHADDTNIHVTSVEKTTWNGKQDKITGAATTITDDNLTVNRALISNSSGKVAVSDVTSTELGYLDGVTSNVQIQLDKKLEKAPVTSVNSKTGAVVLTANDVGALPADTVIPTVNNATLTIKRNNIDVGSFTANSANDVNININVPTDKSDIGLSNVDNVKQYSATNPPPYPVTSVNGHTGAVTVHEVPAVTISDNGKFLRVVDGAWAAVAIANANGGSF